MAKLILRIDDVGRRPGDPPSPGSDGDLEYFRRWRETCGLQGKPAVYGATPKWLTGNGLRWLLENITTPERLALHGWDHSPGAVVHHEQLHAGKMALSTNTYIPPFNAYTEDTLQAWGNVGGRYFLGGFHGEHHHYGPLPVKVGCFHLPALRECYGHAGELLENLPAVLANLHNNAAPVVVTLHVPWDTPQAARQVVELVEDHLVSLEYVNLWLPKLSPDFTAPHRLAMEFLCEHVAPFSSVLDFGSSDKPKAAQLGLRGCRVTCYDRDPRVQRQGNVFADAGAPHAVVYAASDDALPEGPYDAVTACWAIQHNPPGVQAQLAKSLAERLRAGGRLVVVSSFTSLESFHQTARKDPQWVLSQADHEKHVMTPSRLRLSTQRYFYYVHDSNEGRWCEREEANATAYVLERS